MLFHVHAIELLSEVFTFRPKVLIEQIKEVLMDYATFVAVIKYLDYVHTLASNQLIYFYYECNLIILPSSLVVSAVSERRRTENSNLPFRRSNSIFNKK
ncbi:hypothetical protein THZG08_70125 [Vibrio owensii]|nr:hypothetical protein THZG08_70125 [Vibrio owensii]CAH1590825.1 hypothetical protein THOA03_70127 [Vibrio owensii]